MMKGNWPGSRSGNDPSKIQDNGEIVSHIEEKWDQVHSKELITLNNVVVRLGAKTDVITSLTF